MVKIGQKLSPAKMVMTNQHEVYIKRTFELALKARGLVAPNPLVGCVVVKNGAIIAEGYHRGPGQDHAEPDALKSLTHQEVAGSTLYCNLEPCCHTDKLTPPCTSLLLDKKPARVVIANLDLNPEVAGRGLAILREAGVEVVTGVLESEGMLLNESFFKYIQTGLPFVHLKIAQTLDGRMSSKTGSSQWITDSNARALVHQWRNDADAVMVGGETALRDDPELTPRLAAVKNKACPQRLVISERELPMGLKLFSDEYKTLTKQLRTHDLAAVFKELGAQRMTSILIEAGPRLASALLEANLVDRLSVFIAPKILGNGPSFYQSERTLIMNEALKLKTVNTEIIGDQVLVSGRF